MDELDLDSYHPFHATRADLLRRLGRHREAAAAYERAAALAPTDAERDFLRLGGRGFAPSGPGWPAAAARPAPRCGPDGGRLAAARFV